MIEFADIFKPSGQPTTINSIEIKNQRMLSQIPQRRYERIITNS